MKQLLVAIGVLALFVAYTLWVRHEQAVPLHVSSQTTSQSTASTSTPTNSQNQSSTGVPSPSSTPSTTGTYKDGSYTGDTADAFYGSVQVSAVIRGGKLTGVTFLQYPNTHDTSVMINQQAMPYLQQEAIQAQSAQVQIVSGATFTSQAFIESLTAALAQAKA